MRATGSRRPLQQRETVQCATLHGGQLVRRKKKAFINEEGKSGLGKHPGGPWWAVHPEQGKAQVLEGGM